MEKYELCYVHLLPEEQIDLHQHDPWELSYIITGGGTRTVGNRNEPFEAGEVVLIPPRVPHCWHFSPRVTDGTGRVANITLTFSDALLTQLAQLFPALHDTVSALRRRTEAVRFPRPRAAAMARRLETMLPQSDIRRIPTLVQLLIDLEPREDDLPAGRHTNHDPAKERLARVKLYVVCNAHRAITLDTTARHIGMNRSAFCAFFKRATGTTFTDYLNRYRITKACRMLRQQRHSVSEVCYRCGFNNVPYFNRVFKRITGQTPTAYITQQTQCLNTEKA